jgi:tRNA(adenine34) deaminase
LDLSHFESGCQALLADLQRMMNDRDFMRQALIEARRAADEDEVPVGAVLVAQDGAVLARAHNQTIAQSDPTAHAEIIALRQGCRVVGNYRLMKAILYVTVEPCIMCLGALLQARIARIVFGARDPKWGGAGSLYNLADDARLNHTIAVEGGLLEEECRVLMQDFFRSKRRPTTN